MRKELFFKKGTEVFELKNPNVIAHMPIIIGKLFMEFKELSSRLCYKMPAKDAPFTTLVDAYDELMVHYLDRGDFLLAVEAYKYAMTNTVRFGNMMTKFTTPDLNDKEYLIANYHIPSENRIMKETLSRFPYFTIEEVKYENFLQRHIRKVSAKEEILSIKVLENHIKDRFPESIFGKIVFE